MRGFYRFGLLALVGPHWRYDLPAPDHGLFEAHPTACTTYLDHLVHGRIAVKPGIERLAGKTVHFTDGSEEEIDLIVYATGFKVSFPFMGESSILDKDGNSKLFIHTFHREFDDLFVTGLFEPAEGGVWQLADYQARVIANFILACADDPKRADWFRRLKATAKPDIGHGIPFKPTPWHRLEVQHYRFRLYLRWLLKKFDATGREAPTFTATKPSERRLRRQALEIAT
jgi:hypothetical protein